MCKYLLSSEEKGVSPCEVGLVGVFQIQKPRDVPLLNEESLLDLVLARIDAGLKSGEIIHSYQLAPMASI